ncbi:MAG: ABC transporter permease [Pseudoxanthomonas sp.]
MNARGFWLGWLLPLTGLLAWSVLSFRHGGDAGTGAVTPWGVIAKTREMLIDGRIGVALRGSLLRYAVGLGIGALAGAAIGLSLGMSPLGRRLFGPTLRALQQVSLFAWVPLVMAWFGLAETSKIVFIALAALFPMLINAFEGVGSVPGTLVEVTHVFGFTRWQSLWRLVLPSALPSLFTGLQLALIYAWLATLGAEYLLTAGEGLGNLLVDGQEQFQTDQVLVGIVLVAALGFAISWLAEWLGAHLLRWKESA